MFDTAWVTEKINKDIINDLSHLLNDACSLKDHLEEKVAECENSDCIVDMNVYMVKLLHSTM